MLGAAIAMVLAAGTAGESPLSFAAALEEAAGSEPVRAFERAIAARHRLDAGLSGFTQNPLLTVQAGRRTPADPLAGPSVEVWLSQGFHPGGYAAARKAGAAAEATVLAFEASDARLAARLAAAAAWFSVWQADARLAAAREEAGVARALVEKSEQAASLGGAIALDVEEARFYASEAALAVLQAEGERFEAGLALARVLGRAGAESLVVADALPALPALRTTEAAALVERARKLPSVAAKFAAVDAEAARALEIEAQRGLALTLGAGLTYDPGGTGGLFTVGATLPAFELGERERAPLVALKEREAGEAAAELAGALGALARALHEVEHTREIVEEYRDHAVPALEARVRMREKLGERGEVNVLELLRARRELLAGRVALQAATAEHAGAAWAWALLEEASGGGNR